MNTTKTFAILATAVLLGACNNGSSADTDKLERRIAALEEDLTAAKTQLAAQAETLTAAGEAVAWADQLRTVMALDANGDVEIAQANLRVHQGRVPSANPRSIVPDGKGNIFIGWDSDRIEGTCSVDGSACTQEGVACGPESTGVCGNMHVTSVKLASHSLVIGEEHSHNCVNTIISGWKNTVVPPDGAPIPYGVYVNGRENSASSDIAAVLSGDNNSAYRGTVVGGSGNMCRGPGSVLLGGIDNQIDDLEMGAIKP